MSGHLTHEEYLDEQRQAHYASTEAYRNDVRVTAFPIIRDGVGCAARPDMRNACNGGSCVCDRIAHDIAEQLAVMP